MATIAKSFKETYYEGSQGTWTVSLSGSDLEVTAENQTIKIPWPTTKVKYVCSGRGYGEVNYSSLYIKVLGGDGTKYRRFYQPTRNRAAMTSGTFYTLTNGPSGNFPWSISASTLFNSSNPTEKVKAIATDGNCSFGVQSGNSAETKWGWADPTNITFGTIGYVYFKCPPTFDVGTLTKNTSDFWDNNITTVSVPISNVSAKYGGNIKSVELTIGNQTVTGSGNGTLSITLNAAGTFTPTITVTDSRDQVSTKTLDPITVKKYIKPSGQFSVVRCESTGESADEGVYGLITAVIDYTDEAATLNAPVVQIDGTVTNNVTWYKTFSGTTLSNQITDWSQVSSGDEIYGLINGNFNITSAYVITMTPSDQYQSAIPILQTLPQAFYTIDFQEPGKEVTFGTPANDDLTNYPNGLFKCAMEMCLTLDTNAGSGTDADIYAALQALGWTDAIE